jgi:hypothetical protein
MDNQQESSDWLQKFKGIFIKDESAPTTTTAPTTTQAPRPSPQTISSIPSVSIGVGIPDGSLIDDLMVRFQKLIEEKNQPGFDFFEYSAMVLGVSQTPAPDHFKMAYQGAKVMNASVSKQQLAESAKFYKQTLENAYLDTVRKGEEKRAAVAQQQASEQKQLNADVDNINKQIADFEKKIAELKTAQAQRNSQLATLTEKFTPQMADVELKLNATTTAKDRVLDRLLLIEDGLNKFVE